MERGSGSSLFMKTMNILVVVAAVMPKEEEMFEKSEMD